MYLSRLQFSRAIPTITNFSFCFSGWLYCLPLGLLVTLWRRMRLGDDVQDTDCPDAAPEWGQTMPQPPAKTGLPSGQLRSSSWPTRIWPSCSRYYYFFFLFTRCLDFWKKFNFLRCREFDGRICKIKRKRNNEKNLEFILFLDIQKIYFNFRNFHLIFFLILFNFRLNFV